MIGFVEFPAHPERVGANRLRILFHIRRSLPVFVFGFDSARDATGVLLGKDAKKVPDTLNSPIVNLVGGYTDTKVFVTCRASEHVPQADAAFCDYRQVCVGHTAIVNLLGFFDPHEDIAILSICLYA